MRKNLIYVVIILFFIGMGIVYSEMATNSRYITNVDAIGNPNLASTYFGVTTIASNPVNISPGESASIQCQLTNKVSSNINENNLKFYIKLLDETNVEATNITISTLKIGTTSYSYVSGKGYGPISLAYDGTTEETKTIDITLSCNSSYRSSSTLNYKINVLAEDATDSTIKTNKTSGFNINVIVYSITYELDGGTNDSNNPSAFIASDIITLSDPTKSGYSFDGWYENSSFTGSKVTTISGRSSNITLYAKWLPLIYFQLPPDWYGTTVYVKMYQTMPNIGEETVTDTMELIDSTKKIYKYKITDTANINNFTVAYFTNNITIEDASGTNPRRALGMNFSTSNIGKIFVPELYNSSTQTRVMGYATNFYFYLWKGNNNNGWPGTSGEVIGKRLHKTTFTNSQYVNMIVNNGNGQNQSGDLTVPTYQDLTYKLTSTKISGKKFQHLAFRLFYFGSWHSYDTWLSSEYATWRSGDYTRFQAAQTALGY